MTDALNQYRTEAGRHAAPAAGSNDDREVLRVAVAFICRTSPQSQRHQQQQQPDR